MLATLADKPFDSEEWVYETKWDGFRLIAEVERDSVRLYSRNGIEVTEGVMAKLASGFYYSGKRTREWLKFKVMNEQEVVAIPPRGVRANTSAPSYSQCVNPRRGSTWGTREQVLTKRRFECFTTRCSL